MALVLAFTEMILGLFVGIALPGLLINKWKREGKPCKRFTYFICMVIGLMMIIYEGINLVKAVS